MLLAAVMANPKLLILICSLFAVSSNEGKNYHGKSKQSTVLPAHTPSAFIAQPPAALAASRDWLQSPMVSTSDPESCDQEYSCLDCWTARVCAPVAGGQSLREIGRTSCPGNKPWCDPSTGSCTSQEPSACVTVVPASNFTCMRDGIFPDLTNCSKYYKCLGDVPYMYTCSGKTPFYSSYDQACVPVYDSNYCANQTGICVYHNGTKVAVPNVSQLFIDCMDNLPLTVDRCIGAYVFDITAQDCVPSCPHAGLFPSAEDCTEYYRCSPTSSAPASTTLTMTLNLTCPQGQGFLEDAFECVDKELVPNCNVKYPSLFN